VFRALFSDKMTAVAVPLNGSTTTTAYSYVANGGEQDHKGVEVLVKYTAFESATGFLRTVRPFGNLAYSHFRYKDFKFQTLNPARTGIVETDYSGKAVAGVPPVTASSPSLPTGRT
jgi:iron complex outermembrane receptor protein